MLTRTGEKAVRSATDWRSAYPLPVLRAVPTGAAALVRSTSPSSIHATVLVGDARPVGADVVDANLGGAHAGTHHCTAAISRGTGLIDSWVHNADAGRANARRHRGRRRCRACNAPDRNARRCAVDGPGGSCGRGRLCHATYGHTRRSAIRYLGGGGGGRRAYHTAGGDAGRSTVDDGGVGGSRNISGGKSQQQRRCLQHFCIPFMIGHGAGQPAGTVKTGETCPLPLSVRVNRNIRKENTPFDGRSRSSIQNQ